MKAKQTEQPVEATTRRFYASFMQWYMTHYANEALPAKFGKINNKDLFTERMREWAKDITTHDE